MAGKIWVALEPDRVQVDAGGQPATMVVAVQNLGTTVDHLSIELEGLEPSWFTFPATVIQLFPTERGQAQIHFQVPRRSDIRSGGYPFTVRVRSRTDPAEVGTAQGVLEIRPYQVYRFDVMPKRVIGRRGSFRAIIQNMGTADVEPQLQGKDPEALCGFHFQTAQPRVVPGSDATVPFTVKPRRSSLVGEPKTFNLTISAATEGGEAKSVAVQFIHQPRFRSLGPLLWSIIGGVVGILLVTALVWPRWLPSSARRPFSSGWGSVRSAICRVSGNRFLCSSALTSFLRYEGFQRFNKSDPSLIGQPLEDEWKDKYGNTHQRTTKGRLLWVGDTNTLYFFAGNKVYTLGENDKAEELKPR